MRLLAATAAMTLFVLFISSVSASSIPFDDYDDSAVVPPSGNKMATMSVGSFIENNDKPMDVSALIILPSSGDIIYPSTLTTMRVRVLNKAPEKVTIQLDSKRSDMYFTYVATSGNFYASKAIAGFVELNSTSKMSFNVSSNSYDVDFKAVFDWDAPFTDRPTVNIVAFDQVGNHDELSVESAYRIERRVVLDGELVLQSTDPAAISLDYSHIKGGAFLVIKGVSLHFYGDVRMSPDPTGFVIMVTDDREPSDTWEYRAARRSDLNRISFSFQMPNCDERLNFSMRIVSYPGGSDPKGQIDFSMIVDSTSPKVYDFRTETGKVMSLYWSFEERSSGIDHSSLSIKIERANPHEIIDWFKPSDIRWYEDRIEVRLELSDGSYSVQVRVVDEVNNVNPGSETFRYYFTTEVRPVHDLAITDPPRIYPETLVAGYASTIGYTLINRGTSAEVDIPIRFMIDDAVIASEEIEELPAGSTLELRYQWAPSMNAKRMELSVDPDGVIDDDDRSNNEWIMDIDVHFRDLSIDPKSMTSSDPEPEDMEIVTLHFRVDCIGDLDSGLVKLTLLQDGRFYGEYKISNIHAGTWDLFKFDWKASYDVQKLTLILDPYNEITESVEDNVEVIENPFYVKPTNEGMTENNGETVPSDEEPVEPGAVGNQVGDPGQTIWIGPETGEIKPGGPTETKVVPSIPSKNEKEDPPSFTIPLLGFTITSTMLAAILLALRNEAFRYKLMMFAIPLYSKLKKEKIEQGTRYEILGYIKARPGSSYTEIKEILDLNDGSLIHHLRILEREDKVYSKKAGKYKLFYVTSYRRKPSPGDFISPFQRRILEVVFSNPGIVPNKLSKILDRSQTDISYHLSELSRNGFLERKKRGRNIQYYIKDEYLDVMMS
jgi:predicted transcriptional regulator